MNRIRQLLDCRLSLHCRRDLCDHICRMRSHDRRAEDLACRCLSHELDKAFRTVEDDAASVAGCREVTCLDIQTLLLCLRLCQTDSCDLRCGVNTGRHDVVSHLLVLACCVGRCHETLCARHMGQLDLAGDITDCVNIRNACLHLIVDFYKASVSHFNTGCLKAEIAGHRTTSDRDHNDITFGFACLAVLIKDNGQAVFDLSDACADMDLHALLGKHACHSDGDIFIECIQDARQSLDNNNLLAEGSVQCRELDTDHTAADNDNAFRKLIACQNAIRIHDTFLIDPGNRDTDRL